MGFFSSIAAPLAGAAGDAVQGYAQDQKDQIARAVQAIQLARQSQNDQISNALKLRQISRPQLGDLGYAKAMGDVAGAEADARVPAGVRQAVETATGVAPIHTAEAVNTATGLLPLQVQRAVQTAEGTLPTDVEKAIATAKGVAPIQQQTHAANRSFDVAHPEPVNIPTAAGVVRVGADGIASPITDAGGNPVVKAGAGGSASGNTLLAQGRLAMSYNDLTETVKQLEDYENHAGNLQNFTPAKRAIGAIAQSQPNGEAHGLGGMLGNALTAFGSGAAQQHLAEGDQAYQNYINNAQRVATALTELLPRPNQQMLGIEKGLSAVDVGGNPGNIANVQSRRRGALQMLQGIMQHGGIPGVTAPNAGTGAGTPPSGSGDPEFDALMASLRKRP